jgi:arginase family enzyme
MSGRFCLGQAGLRSLIGGLIGIRIDLVQDLACLDVAAFGKQALLDDAANLGRISATVNAEMRAGSSRVITVSCGCSVTTPTLAGPAAGMAAFCD